MSKSNSDKELEKIYQELREMNSSSGGSGSNEGNELLRFFVGLVMLAGGLFMIFNNLSVSSSWGTGGYIFRIGSMGVSNGMVMLPVIVGIGMLCLMKRKIFGWIVIAIGIAIVLLSVLLSTRIYWRSTSAYIFIIMFGLTAAGAGLVLRELFKKK